MKVRNEVSFALIPEWVVFADISSHAVRLYAILNRHANTKRVAQVRRVVLAEELRVKTPKTVDRALEDLKEIGAIEVEPDFKDGKGRISNKFVVRATPKKRAEQVSIPLDTDVQGGSDTCVQGPLDTGVQGKNKSSPYERSSPLPPPPNGGRGNPRERKTNPRAKGTNPRAVAEQERQGRRKQPRIIELADGHKVAFHPDGRQEEIA